VGALMFSSTADIDGGTSVTQAYIDYAFVTYSAQSTLPAKLLRGDLTGDGKINAADARVALQAGAGKVTLTGNDPALGDANRDGKVNAADARLMLQMGAGKITAFP